MARLALGFDVNEHLDARDLALQGVLEPVADVVRAGDGHLTWNDEVKFDERRLAGAARAQVVAQQAAGHAQPQQLALAQQGADARIRIGQRQRDAVIGHLPESTIIVKSAAVADYHRANVPQQKVKKTSTHLTLDLEPTPDILAECGRNKGDRILIGFAAETNNVIDYARSKLTKKNCDMIVANNVAQSGTGFDANDNEVTLVLRDTVIPIAKALKTEIAHRIFDQIVRLRLALHSAR